MTTYSSGRPSCPFTRPRYDSELNSGEGPSPALKLAFVVKTLVGVDESGLREKYSGRGFDIPVVSNVTWRWMYGWDGMTEEREGSVAIPLRWKGAARMMLS